MKWLVNKNVAGCENEISLFRPLHVHIARTYVGKTGVFAVYFNAKHVGIGGFTQNGRYIHVNYALMNIYA